MPGILIVDDQELMREMLEETFARRGYDVFAAENGERALELFAEKGPDVVITDLKMPGMDGIELLGRIREKSGDVPVILVTAHGTVPTAVSAMKDGAFDYIEKPFKADEISMIVDKALEHARLLEQNRDLKRELSRVGKTELVLGNSEAMKKVDEAIEKAKDAPVTVLVTGESGTGKEVVARALHERSVRSGEPFIAVNCAALSAGLLESELFGHEKGAFTGAHERRKGRFELADKGTVLLDEVSEIEPALQAKLLRVLQEQAFERVGSSATIGVDVRVIATTNRDLKSEIKKGSFREDLFFRLNVISIEAPPLRNRLEDLDPLLEHFVAKHAPRTRFREWEIEPGVVEACRKYDWPGNVRELENMVERAMILSGEPRLMPENFSGYFERGERGAEFSFEGMTLEEIEKVAIKHALEKFNGHQEKTAEALGIAVRTLRTKVKKWELK